MISLKKLYKAGFVLSLMLFAVFPLVIQAKTLDKIAAKVNAEIITLSSVKERGELLRKKYAQSSVSISEHELLKEALTMIIEEKLQFQEGKKRGFIVDEASIDAAVNNISEKNGLIEGQLQEMLEREGRSLSSYRKHIRQQIMVSKVSRFEISSRIQVSDKEINQYYKSRQKEFWEDGQVRARHILFIVEPGSSESNRKEKLEQAKQILSEIRKGGDFSEIAREYSEDISASNGGDVGFVSRGKMVAEFEEAVFSLKPGQVSDIVSTEYGYHIIKAEETLAGKTLTLKESKDRIVKILSVKKEKQGYQDWMEELKKSAFIEVSLFGEPDKNNSMLFSDLEEEKNDSSMMKKKKLNSGAHSQKQILQKKWEEMYKSVEKSKEKDGSQLKSLKEQLKHIKKLRYQNTISEDEYQHRKSKLLNRL